MKKGFENILLIGDDQLCIQIASIILQHSAYRKPIHKISNGKQALEFLIEQCLEQTENSFCPALVVLDLTIPIMNGVEFLEAFVGNKRLQQAYITIIVTC